MISVGCMALRRIRRQPLLPSVFSLGVWGLPINLGALAYIIVATVISFFPAMADPTPQTMNWASLVYSVVLIVAALYYYFTGRHYYVGPVLYVNKEE
jgi:choline transport protein